MKPSPSELTGCPKRFAHTARVVNLALNHAGHRSERHEYFDAFEVLREEIGDAAY